MNETLSQHAWEALPEEKKRTYIIDGLIRTDLQFADPDFSRWYTDAKAATNDTANGMRLDIQMFDRVHQLREEGKMLSLEKLQPFVANIMTVGSDQLLKAFSDFYRGRQSGQITG